MITNDAHGEGEKMELSHGCYWLGETGLVYWNDGKQTFSCSAISDPTDWTPIYEGIIYAQPEEAPKPALPHWKQEQRKHKWNKK